MRSYFNNKYKEVFQAHFNKYGHDYAKHIDNTQTFKEVIIDNDYLNKNGNNKFSPNAYIPPKVRSEYQNFEILNQDICRTEGVKGIINFPLWSQQNWRSMIPNTSTVGDPQIYATDDVKFFFDDDKKYYGNEYQKTILQGGECK